MLPAVDPRLLFVAGAAIVGGLTLLWRGFAAYRRAGLIAGTSTSTVASLAAGEVRVSGVVEAAELALVSPLQSARCIYYRASVSQADQGSGTRTMLDEERAVGFRVTDATGSVRVFPRGARFDVPECYSESTGAFGDRPPGLQLRDGSAIAVGEPDREAQIAALLTVHRPAAVTDTGSEFTLSGMTLGFGQRGGAIHYHEARIEPGQQVTVVGRALPFDQLEDPDGADENGVGAVGREDPEIAADIAAARAAGTLAADASSAWGNAAIPGFGIGRPVTQPSLDTAARRPSLATAEAADKVRRTFEIRPEEIVLAAAVDAPLMIALGAPGDATARAQVQFLVGLLGAVLAIGGAIALALMLQGGLR